MRGFHVWDPLGAHFLASRKVSLDYLWAHFGLMSYTRLQIPNLSHFSLKLNLEKNGNYYRILGLYISYSYIGTMVKKMETTICAQAPALPVSALG